MAVKDYARAAAARERIDALLVERARAEEAAKAAAEAAAEAAEEVAKAAAAAAAAGCGDGGFAPKHGVRLLTRALDLQMVLPLLLANPVCALDLEGNLDPGGGGDGGGFGVDLIQVCALPLRLDLLQVRSGQVRSGQVRSVLHTSSRGHTRGMNTRGRCPQGHARPQSDRDLT